MTEKVVQDDEEFPWHLGVYDAHCHPTDTMASIADIPSMRAQALTIMATRAQDQQLVAETAEKLGLAFENGSHQWNAQQKIIPSFGWHPWFSHQMFDETQYGGTLNLSEEAKIIHYQSVLTPKSEDRIFLLSLPDPRPFTHFLNQTRKHLEQFPLALVGEVGLDRSFRIPEDWLPENKQQRDNSLTPGGREGRRLSPYRVSMDHQRSVLKAQLLLAGEMQRAVSVHGVQAHGIVFEALKECWKGHEEKVPSKRQLKKASSNKGDNAVETESSQDRTSLSKPYPPRICLHSYSGPPDTVKMYLSPANPVTIYFSFSTAINFSTSAAKKTEEAIRAVPEGNILVESDLHTAGKAMDDRLEDIVRTVCKLKSWSLEEGVKQLAQNWQDFIFGSK